MRPPSFDCSGSETTCPLGCRRWARQVRLWEARPNQAQQIAGTSREHIKVDSRRLPRCLPSLPEALKRRRNTGLALYIVGQLVGGGLLLLLFLLPALFDTGVCGAMCMGIVLALPACAIYLTVPRLLDRYDPEPWYALLGCLAWGGIAACGFSAAINSTVGLCGLVAGGEGTGDVLSAVVSAPLVEEFFKGMGVWGSTTSCATSSMVWSMESSTPRSPRSVLRPSRTSSTTHKRQARGSSG